MSINGLKRNSSKGFLLPSTVSPWINFSQTLRFPFLWANPSRISSLRNSPLSSRLEAGCLSPSAGKDLPESSSACPQRLRCNRSNRYWTFSILPLSFRLSFSNWVAGLPITMLLPSEKCWKPSFPKESRSRTKSPSRSNYRSIKPLSPILIRRLPSAPKLLRCCKQEKISPSNSFGRKQKSKGYIPSWWICSKPASSK